MARYTAVPPEWSSHGQPADTMMGAAGPLVSSKCLTCASCVVVDAKAALNIRIGVSRGDMLNSEVRTFGESETGLEGCAIVVSALTIERNAIECFVESRG